MCLPTIIYRHRKENKKKCSLTGLEKRPDCCFFTYPKEPLPSLNSYVLLTIDAPVLSENDADKGLFLIDATWRYAQVMEERVLQEMPIEKRSLPKKYLTAYPRKQTGCLYPSQGLASIEALFLAYYITKRDTSFLLKNYYWKQKFLTLNQLEEKC